MEPVWKGLIEWPAVGIRAVLKAGCVTGYWTFRGLAATTGGAVAVMERIEGKGRAGEPHGSSRWADRQKLKKGRNLQPGGFLVGNIEKWSWWKQPVYTHHANSLVMFGPPGSGKSSAVIGNLLRADDWHGIVYDPAGKVAKATKSKLERAGYEVRIINLSGPTQGQKFNPLTYLMESGPATFERDARELAELIAPREGDSDAGKHFGTLAQLFIAMVTTQLVASDGSWTMARIVEVLLADTKALDALIKKAVAAGFTSTLAERIAIKAYLALSDREKSAVVSTMTNALMPWADLSIQTLTNDPNYWSFGDMLASKKPVMVFISGGASYKTISGAYARTVLGCAVNTVMRFLDAEVEPQRGLKIFVDEAANIGRCEAIIRAHGELRKVKTRVALMYLDGTAMTRAMGNEASTILHGSDVMIPGGLKDVELLGNIVKLLGKKTENSMGQSVSDHGKSDSRSQFAKDLATIDELMGLDEGEVVLLLGNKPAKLMKLPPQ